MKKLAGGIFILGCLAACSSGPREPAPITDLDRGITPIKAKITAAKGEYIVQQGDNLYRIALEHGMAYRDLAVWNDLADVNDIKAGQVLKITGPEEDKGSMGEIQPAKVRTIPLTPSANNISEASAPVHIQTEDNKTTSSKTSAEAGEIGLNMSWPARGNLLSSFSKNGKGIDIGGKLGQPIFAAADGVVVYVGGGLRGYGKMVILKHNTTYLTAYAHNNTLLVKEGVKVKQGQKIAEMGNTDTDSVKLHFEVRRFGKPVDPTKYLPN